MKPFPWQQAMGFGFGVLRLAPDVFWRMTPRELAQAIRAIQGPGAVPLARAELDELWHGFPMRRARENLMTDETSLQDTSSTLDSLTAKTQALTISAGGFARAMTQAFSSSVSGGKQFDDVLKTLALRVSNAANAYKALPLCRTGTEPGVANICAKRSEIGRLQSAMRKARLAVNNLVALQKTYPSVDITNALAAAQSALIVVQQILVSGA